MGDGAALQVGRLQTVDDGIAVGVANIQVDFHVSIRDLSILV